MPSRDLKSNPEVHQIRLKDDDEERRNCIRDTVVQNSHRNDLLLSLGFEPSQDVDLNREVGADFLVAPQVKG